MSGPVVPSETFQSLHERVPTWDAEQDELLLEALQTLKSGLLGRAHLSEQRLVDMARRTNDLDIRFRTAMAKLDMLSQYQFVEHRIEDEDDSSDRDLPLMHGEAECSDSDVEQLSGDRGSDLLAINSSLDIGRAFIEAPPPEMVWAPLPPVIGSTEFWAEKKSPKSDAVAVEASGDGDHENATPPRPTQLKDGDPLPGGGYVDEAVSAVRDEAGIGHLPPLQSSAVEPNDENPLMAAVRAKARARSSLGDLGLDNEDSAPPATASDPLDGLASAVAGSKAVQNTSKSPPKPAKAKQRGPPSQSTAGGLFGDDDDDLPAAPAKNKSLSKNSALFGDDEDGGGLDSSKPEKTPATSSGLTAPPQLGALIGKQPASLAKPPVANTGLFGDDEPTESFGGAGPSKKKGAKKNSFGADSLFGDDDPAPGGKKNAAGSSLFDDDSQPSKQPAKAKQSNAGLFGDDSVSSRAPAKSKAKPPRNAGLFGDDDEGSGAPAKSKPKSPRRSRDGLFSNDDEGGGAPAKSKPKSPRQNHGLFGADDEGSGAPAEPKPKPPRNAALFGDDDEGGRVPSKSKAKPPRNAGLFGDDDEGSGVPSKSKPKTSRNAGLFGEDDDDDSGPLGGSVKSKPSNSALFGGDDSQETAPRSKAPAAKPKSSSAGLFGEDTAQSGPLGGAAPKAKQSTSGIFSEDTVQSGPLGGGAPKAKQSSSEPSGEVSASCGPLGGEAPKAKQSSSGLFDSGDVSETPAPLGGVVPAKPKQAPPSGPLGGTIAENNFTVNAEGITAPKPEVPQSTHADGTGGSARERSKTPTKSTSKRLLAGEPPPGSIAALFGDDNSRADSFKANPSNKSSTSRLTASLFGDDDAPRQHKANIFDDDDEAPLPRKPQKPAAPDNQSNMASLHQPVARPTQPPTTTQPAAQPPVATVSSTVPPVSDVINHSLSAPAPVSDSVPAKDPLNSFNHGASAQDSEPAPVSSQAPSASDPLGSMQPGQSRIAALFGDDDIPAQKVTFGSGGAKTKQGRSPGPGNRGNTSLAGTNVGGSAATSASVLFGTDGTAPAARPGVGGLFGDDQRSGARSATADLFGAPAAPAADRQNLFGGSGRSKPGGIFDDDDGGLFGGGGARKKGLDSLLGTASTPAAAAVRTVSPPPVPVHADPPTVSTQPDPAPLPKQQVANDLFENATPSGSPAADMTKGKVPSFDENDASSFFNTASQREVGPSSPTFGTAKQSPADTVTVEEDFTPGSFIAQPAPPASWRKGDMLDDNDDKTFATSIHKSPASGMASLLGTDPEPAAPSASNDTQPPSLNEVSTDLNSPSPAALAPPTANLPAQAQSSVDEQEVGPGVPSQNPTPAATSTMPDPMEPAGLAQPTANVATTQQAIAQPAPVQSFRRGGIFDDDDDDGNLFSSSVRKPPASNLAALLGSDPEPVRQPAPSKAVPPKAPVKSSSGAVTKVPVKNLTTVDPLQAMRPSTPPPSNDAFDPLKAPLQAKKAENTEPPKPKGPIDPLGALLAKPRS